MTNNCIYALPNSKHYPIEEDFEIKAQLGDGQYSVVKVAVNKRTNEEVAIKIIHRSQTETYEFINEVDLMREVSDHPGFIKLLDIYEDEKNFIIVMELVRGGELFDKIGELTTYTEERVAKLLYQIVSGLAYMHSKRIVHRDLKPENLLFGDESGTVIKLCDFGVAEKIPERGYLTEVIGTESYMAPEVEEGKPYGVSSDMYGLGVIMYIMLCGYPPFEPENGIVDLEFPDEEWGSMSPVVKELITKLLDRDPAKRPTAQEVLGNPWFCGETHKEELQDTVKTVRIYTHIRAFGGQASMREMKANKKEAVWSIFSNGGLGKKPNKSKASKLISFSSSSDKKKVFKEKNKKLKPKDSVAEAVLSPRTSQAHNEKKLQQDTVRSAPSFISQSPKKPPESPPADELQLASLISVTRDPDALIETISILESKLVSLTNINCALQSQIDDLTDSLNILQFERDDIKRTLDESVQEIEQYRKKQKEKK